jgi:polar amino acid transport system substrate-binding protein
MTRTRRPDVPVQEPGVYRTLGEPFRLTVIGIGVAKDKKPLQHALRSLPRATVNDGDGDYTKLIAKWGLRASSARSRATINKGLRGPPW